jgi:hypothetical protein
MGLWSALFGKDGQKQDQPPQEPKILFDSALRQAVAHYSSGESSEGALEAVLPPQTASERFPAQFAEWTGVRSPWDRRGILFGLLDELIGNTLAPWQRAERFTEDRRPREAAEALHADAAGPAVSDPRFCAAYAKTLLCLDQPDEAVVWARRGLDAAGANGRLRVLVADAQHMLGNVDEAHAVYEGMLPPTLFASKGNEVRAVFDQLFSFGHGVVRSPIFAFSILAAGDKFAQELWPLVEDEFYWSPYFRAQHAYDLARGGDSMRAFSKLMVLVQEMPWLAEATLNCMQFLVAFDPDGSRGLCPEDRQRMEKTIEERGWSMKNLKPLEPIPFDIGAERRRLGIK